jgi:hypothetical protein
MIEEIKTKSDIVGLLDSACNSENEFGCDNEKPIEFEYPFESEKPIELNLPLDFQK